MGLKLFVGKVIDKVLDQLIRYNYRWAAFVPTGRVLTLDLKRWHFTPKVIFDVGANEGQTALYFKKHFKTSEIYCFEPVSAVFDLLKRHCRHPDIHCFQQALGHESTVKKIFKSASYNGLASINGAAQDHLSQEEDIRVTTGKTVYDQLGLSVIDLLKIDTEGYELQVLQGFGPLLRTKVRMVFAETTFSKTNPCQTYIGDLIDYLSDNGFIVSGIYNQFRFSAEKSRLHHCDILLTNQHLCDV